ncbi:anti-sigma factor family protein [Caenispirillum salinarum]|uniref:anti-sigma factor family protein n=1 Tax=Caenispirillum salinarum TaxID=859058 RepID=UPI003850EB2A
MTNEPITDLDILAYADGRLDRDPARRRLVEREMANDPELVARVAAFRSQDEAIRAAFPLPSDDMPVDTSSARRSRTAPRAWRHAATIALMLASGGVGWLAATDSESVHPHLSAFTDGTFLSELQPVTASAIEGADEAPLLADAGYALIDTKPISRNGARLEQFTFQNDVGRVVRVFRQRRGPETMPPIPVVERDGSSMAVWEDGPYAYGLLTSEDPAEARNLAEIARRNIRKLGMGRFTVTDNGSGPSAARPQVTTSDPASPPPQPAVEQGLPGPITDG